MRLAAALVAFLTLTPHASVAADFFVGDPGTTQKRPRTPASLVFTTDGDTFYLFSDNGMNRIRPDGTIMDAEAFGVPEMRKPDSAAYGRGILVVTYRNDFGWIPMPGYATAMTTEGRLQWERIVAPDRASVVYDGRDFIVLSSDDDQRGIIASVLDDEGFVTRSIRIASVPDGSWASTPAVARTDRGLLAVWRENYDIIRAVAFDASGPLGEPSTVATGFYRDWTDGSGSVAVASNGPGALVVWDNTPNNEHPDPELAARQLDATGAPITEVFQMPYVGRAMSPDAIWDGSRYRVTWVAQPGGVWDTNIAYATVHANTSFAAALELAVTDRSCTSPALAVARGRIVLGWNDFVRGGVRGKLADLDSSLTFTVEQLLKTEPFDAVAPAVVRAGDHYVVSWVRAPGTTNDTSVVFRRFDRRGSPLDLVPRVLFTMNDVPVIRVASNGQETALVWTDDNKRLLVVRIAADGSSIDPQPMIVATNAFTDSADVASDGRDFAIAWAGSDVTNVRRLSARAGFIDQSPLVTGQRLAHPVSATRMTFDGTNYLIGMRSGGRIHAALLTRNGSLEEPVWLLDTSEGDFAIGSNGNSHLFIGGRQYVFTDRDLGNRRPFSSCTGIKHPNVVWGGSTFIATDDYRYVSITPSGACVTVEIPSVWHDFGQTAVATARDGAVLLIFSAPTRTFHAALFGRVITPRRRSAGH